MRLLLDTNVVSDFVRGEPLVRQALLACAPKDVAVSSVTVMEIAYGLARNPARAPDRSGDRGTARIDHDAPLRPSRCT